MAACPQIQRKLPEPRYAWDRSECLALANQECRWCWGMGYRMRGRRVSVCNCVLRAVFRRCFNQWLTIQQFPGYLAHVTLDRHHSGSRCGFVFGNRAAEYSADFELVSRSALLDDPRALDIFRLHFLLGAGWRECCKQLHISRGLFFHLVYSVEGRLGRALRELRPYALHPIEEYFSGPSRGQGINEEEVGRRR
jgi:hypothetical protein